MKHKGGVDAFWVGLYYDLSDLVNATFIGGSSSDEARALALDRYNNVYIAGQTSSNNFPTTPGSYRTNTHFGGGFISKFSRAITGFEGVEYMYELDPFIQDILNPFDVSVDPSMGSHIIERSLLQVQGAQTLDFRVRYNSLLLKEGQMGKGWGHNFETRLEILENGNVKVRWNANRVSNFIYDQTISEYSPADLANRFDNLLLDTNGDFILTCSDQTTYRFNSSGRLLEQKNRSNQPIQMSYDSSGQLCNIVEGNVGTCLLIPTRQGELLAELMMRETIF